MLDATFTRLLSYDELFGAPQHQALRRCRELLEAEALDVELAAALNVEQLERVLAGERLGDIMRVKKLLEGARVAVKPPSVGACAFGRVLAAGTLRGDLHMSLLIMFEISVVMSSLLFTVSATWLLSNVQRCAFEGGVAAPSAACNRVVWADSIFWLMATAMYWTAAVINWMMIYHLLTLTHEDLSRWLTRNIRLGWMGIFLSIHGFFPMNFGFCTRIYLTTESEVRGLVMGGVYLLLTLVVGYVWWFASVQSIYGLRASSLLEYQLGQFGFAGNFLKLFPGKFAGLD